MTSFHSDSSLVNMLNGPHFSTLRSLPNAESWSSERRVLVGTALGCTLARTRHSHVGLSMLLVCVHHPRNTYLVRLHVVMGNRLEFCCWSGVQESRGGGLLSTTR